MNRSDEPGPRIALSPNFLHRDESRDLYGGRPLLYLEQSMATWVMRAGGRPYLVPAPGEGADVATAVDEMLDGMDGLLLQGGADIAPESYGESPLDEQWTGDPVRDRHELALFEAALEAELPVLGICRGVQMINVARGGTLYQDLETQLDGAAVHRDRERYDGLTHGVDFGPGSQLRDLYGEEGGTVVSVHHQGIRSLGEGLEVEARSRQDGLVEGIRLQSMDLYVVGVQWHPEFQDPTEESLLDPMPLLEDFLAAARSAAELRQSRR